MKLHNPHSCTLGWAWCGTAIPIAQVWSLALPSGRSREGQLSAVGQASLTARPASLKEYRNSNFVSVAAVPSDGATPQTQALMYALTQNGMLLTLRPAIRTIDKSLSLQVRTAGLDMKESNRFRKKWLGVISPTFTTSSSNRL